MKKDAEKRKVGASRMLELGYKQVQLWLDEAEYKAINNACAGQPLATVARRLLCEMAKHPFHRR